MSDFDPVEISEKKGVRYLHLGSPSVQSAMRIRDPYALELEYTRAMMAFLLFKPAPANIALIGLGGGSIAKFIHKHLTDSRLTVLEINPEVVNAARSFFMLPEDNERLQIITGDGAHYVREQDGSLDVLLVDGYDAFRIDEALASPDFYDACLRALAPGGLAAFNLWGSDRFFDIYRERVGRAFADQILLLPAERKGNIQLFAFKPPLPRTALTRMTAEAKVLEARLGLEMPAFVERLKDFNPASKQGLRLCKRGEGWENHG